MSMYNIHNEDKAFKYFKLRFLLYNLDKKVKNIDNFINLSNFLLTELNIPITDNSFFYYKENKISIIDSIYNIIENWNFRASLVEEINVWDKRVGGDNLALEEFIKLYYINTIKSVKSKQKKQYMSKDEHLIVLKLTSIKTLSESFSANVNYPKIIRDIKYTDSHNPFKRTIEDELNSLVECIKIKSPMRDMVSENILEKYMIRNIQKIEKGLKYIDSQVMVKSGRIDILAKDKNNKYVAIELKVDEDKQIIWQCTHYPEAIKEKYKVNEVRMLTLCPYYNSHISEILKTLDTEMYIYSIDLSFGKIKDISIQKYI